MQLLRVIQTFHLSIAECGCIHAPCVTEVVLLLPNKRQTARLQFLRYVERKTVSSSRSTLIRTHACHSNERLQPSGGQIKVIITMTHPSSHSSSRCLITCIYLEMIATSLSLRKLLSVRSKNCTKISTKLSFSDFIPFLRSLSSLSGCAMKTF